MVRVLVYVGGGSHFCAAHGPIHLPLAPLSTLVQDGRERTAAFGNDPTKSVTQTMADFISRNSIYNKWTEDGWFKGTMGEATECP